MTTSALRPNRTIRATIKGKMEKLNNQGAYLSVQILRDGMRFPESLNCWDPKQLEYTKLNDVVSLILHCDGKKADKEDDGQDNSYWWSIAGVGDAPATTLADPRSGAAPKPPGPSAAQQHAGTGTPEKRETGASTPATWVDQRDPTRASIERQVALKAAVELAGYNITMGKAIGAKDIMAVATLFDRWLGRAFNVEAEPETAPE